MKSYTKELMENRKKRLDSLVLTWPETTATFMFGSPGYRVSGTLFGFLINDGIIITKLPESQRKELFESGKGKIFKAHNKVIRNWIAMPFTNEDDLQGFIPQLKSSYEAASKETVDRE